MAEAPRRRLPTKTRSGIITLPAANSDALAQPLAQVQEEQLQASIHIPPCLDDYNDDLAVAQKRPGHLKSAPPSAPHDGFLPQPPDEQPEATRAAAAGDQTAIVIECCGTPHGRTTTRACREGLCQDAAETSARPQPCEEQDVQAKPRPAVSLKGLPPGAKPFMTGPLNSSTAPAVVSLPVKRRGSFQTLKKLPGARDLSNKCTHWEKFGTILVLYCADDLSPQNDGGILQMMMAEGYDTEVVDCQAEAIKAFNSRETYPDMVLVDADHTYNTLQLIKQLQTQLSTVAIAVIGGPQTRPGPLTALQAGATDYMRKPVDVEELMARVERHVQRQHCVKLEMESTMDKVKSMIARLAAPGLDPIPHAVSSNLLPPASVSRGGLISVAETDFEEQMGELCEENTRLMLRISDLERKLDVRTQQNRLLEEKLHRLSTEGRQSFDNQLLTGRSISSSETAALHL